MGRIKTDLVKRNTHKLFDKFGNEFSEDYKANKVVVRKHTTITSSKIINIIAGYATRLTKQSKQEKVPRKVVPAS